jgi:hypothetical protein|nr:MAG TPA: hypothetical protein [Caudoviricetes sp.]
MAKGSGNTRSSRPSSQSNFNSVLLEKIIQRNKFMMNKESITEYVNNSLKEGKSEKEILDKWYYSDKSSAPTSGGTRTYLTKNGNYEVNVEVSGTYRAAPGRKAVKDKTRTVTIKKDGNIIYNRNLTKDTMKEYRREFNKMWE